jgi:hypothetical protein
MNSIAFAIPKVEVQIFVTKKGIGNQNYKG